MSRILLLLLFQFLSFAMVKAQFVACESMPLTFIAQDAKLQSAFGSADSAIIVPIVNNSTNSFAYPLARLVEITPLPPGMTYHGGNHWQVFASSWNFGDTIDAFIEFDVAQPIPANYSVTFKLYVSNFGTLPVDSCLFSNLLIVNLNPVVSMQETAAKTNAWRLSPNPAIEYFEILWVDAVEEEMELIDTQGKLIKNYMVASKRNRISVSDLENGIYFLRMKKAGTIKKLCIIK